MSEFLRLEIGREEIPARFLTPAKEGRSALIREAFAGARIAFGDISIQTAPRRMALFVQDVAEKQAETVTVKFGPPYNRAFDEAGLRLNEKLILYRHEGTLEKLRTIIDLMGDPEAIYAMGGMLYAITPILREKEVDFDRCLLIGEEVVWKPDFRGWQISQDFDALAELAVQQLLAEIGGAPRRDQMLPRIITPIS